VTGVPGTVGRPGSWPLPRAPGRRKTPRASRLERIAVPPLVLRALPFLALAFFASAHWAALVEPAQTRRALVASLVATLGGVLIGASARLPRVAGTAVRVALVIATGVIAVTAIGIRFKLLMPAGWGTLGDRVSGGLSVVGSVTQWPYAGPNVWLRLTTLLAAPLVLTIAAALVFWPRASARRLPGRTLALVLLVVLYAIPVAARPFDHQALRGVGLLVCLAAWLWLPRLSGRDAVAAATAIGIAALVALAVTPKLASSHPWVDYRHWSWTLHKETTITFDWRQNYGPLHWPRKGTTLLLIKSKHPHYWKAETLDRFDGRGWTTTNPADADQTIGIAGIVSNPKWLETVHVTVRSLRSDVVIAPGSVLRVTGLDSSPIQLSNETALNNGELAAGDTYTVRTYAPDPSAKQMRAAPAPDPAFVRYTTLDVPQRNGFVASQEQVPLYGQPGTGDPYVAQNLQQSRYARIYRLARAIVGNATTQYDMVSRIGAWLEGHFTYSEKVPNHPYPLEAFLFQDKRGYCQQFSGTAALMLRMLGIPTRVASGFAPGTLDRDTHEYVVRDLDAHAWIEVWFERIGWVPFDPTPAQAPASSQAASFAPFSEVASAARGDNRDRRPPKRENSTLGRAGGGAGAKASAGGGTPWGWIVTGFIVTQLALAAVVVTLIRMRARRKPLPPPSGDPEVDHLIRLLGRLGLEIPRGATLLDLEQRLRRLGGDDAAGYAQRLRRRRFGSGDEPPPGRAERRRLRQVLAKAVDAGLLARLHLAMPDNLWSRHGIRGLARLQRSH
jgi:protein-glutamine gamma-glutamyltransferase